MWDIGSDQCVYLRACTTYQHARYRRNTQDPLARIFENSCTQENGIVYVTSAIPTSNSMTRMHSTTFACPPKCSYCGPAWTYVSAKTLAKPVSLMKYIRAPWTATTCDATSSKVEREFSHMFVVTLNNLRNWIRMQQRTNKKLNV